MIKLALCLATLSAMGAFIFSVFRWQYRNLVNLRAKHELSMAQRLAARWQRVIVILIGISHLTSLYISLALNVLHPAAIAFIFLAANIPGFVWWLRHVSELRDIGMYPPNNSVRDFPSTRLD